MSEHQVHHDVPESEKEHQHQHIVPVSTYLIVFAILMVLLFVTVWVAYQPLGSFNLMVALTIAVVKGILIVMYFMEVKYGSKLLWAFVGSSFIFLMFFFILTMNDYVSRGWHPR
ncbi:MAG TPA: cytochrome C oxidase subunit IV family protein [Blastocatellia bacterium]|nr:cytochrome C oxidase subunit IV family protein [Blastocatellia bacterium]